MCAEGKQSARAPPDWIGARAIVQPLRIVRAQSNLNPFALLRRCSFGRMNDGVACPRGDSCHYCLSFAFIHKYSFLDWAQFWTAITSR